MNPVEPKFVCDHSQVREGHSKFQPKEEQNLFGRVMEKICFIAMATR